MKQVTRFFILLVLLFSTSFFVFAQDYEISFHEINVKVDDEGYATVVERFELTFPTELAKDEFRLKSNELGSNIDKWKKFNFLFKPSIGTKEYKNLKVSYNEGKLTTLELSYSLKSPLMAKGQETSIKKEFVLKATYLDIDKFFSSGLWVIPENTKMIFELPANSEIKEGIDPSGTITTQGLKTIIEWNGYASANKISFEYSIWKQIATPFDLNGTIRSLIGTEEGLAIIIIFLIIAGIIFWKRKKLKRKVEDFVITNSEI